MRSFVDDCRTADFESKHAFLQGVGMQHLAATGTTGLYRGLFRDRNNGGQELAGCRGALIALGHGVQ
jgi:hypothetical protein